MTSGVQPGAWCRYSLPPNDLGAPDCPQGPPQRAASNVTFLLGVPASPTGDAQAGLSRLCKPVGPKPASYCLVFTHKCRV